MYKLGCDRNVVALLRGRTLGNSPTALHNANLELHTDEWLHKQLRYLEGWLLGVPPGVQTWGMRKGRFLYPNGVRRDVGTLSNGNWTQWEVCIDSRDMCWYRLLVAQMQDPPLVLYTDQDCCSISGTPRAKELFKEWDHLQVSWNSSVSLTIYIVPDRCGWTYCISCEGWLMVAPLNHTLSMVCLWHGYRVPSLNKMIKIIGGDIYVLLILSRLFIFSQLCDAKRGCLQDQGVSQPSMNAIEKAVTKDEMVRHCRRRTWGVEDTFYVLEELLLQLTPAIDTLGVPLYRYIWLCVFISWWVQLHLVSSSWWAFGRWNASNMLARSNWHPTVYHHRKHHKGRLPVTRNNIPGVFPPSSG